MGYLTGKVTPDYQFAEGDIRKTINFPRFTKEALEKNREIVALLQEVGGRYDATSGQVALAWLLPKETFHCSHPRHTFHSKYAGKLGCCKSKTFGY